jgi:mRNA interferase RelE/StbE
VSTAPPGNTDPPVPPAYTVRLSSRAERDLDKIRDPDFKRIDAKILGLTRDPRPFGAEKLAGTENEYRIRQGDWRIVYQIYEEEKVVFIAGVRRRNERTYR